MLPRLSALPGPPLPFDVARTDGATPIVLRVSVYAVVAKVVLGDAALSVAGDRNTRAAAGAGTLMTHVLVLAPATGEHVTVLMTSVPIGRPSDSKLLPKVWFAHVILPLCETDGADRYL